MNPILKHVLTFAAMTARVMVPGFAEAEEAIKGIRRGTERRKYVVQLAKAAPEVAEFISQSDIVDNALYEEALDNLNDALFKLTRSVRPRTTTR